MKTLKTLEDAIDEAFKDKTEPKDIETLAILKDRIKAAQEEAKASEEATTKLAEKYRDTLLQAGSYKPNGTESEGDADKHVSFEECLARFEAAKAAKAK